MIKACSGLTKRETRTITQIPLSEHGKLIYSGTPIKPVLSEQPV